MDTKVALSILADYRDKYTILDSNNANKVLAEIQGGQKLLVRITTSQYKIIDVSFDIEGAREVVDDLRAKCKSFSDRNIAKRPAPALPEHQIEKSTSKPNLSRTPALDSKAPENTLERLRALQEQREVSRGNTLGGLTDEGNAMLSVQVRNSISDHLRKCWTGNPSALEFGKRTVRLRITTDATGTTRIAEIAPSDTSHSDGGLARAAAERVRRAVLDPQCAELPLPAAMKGQKRTFEITFLP